MVLSLALKCPQIIVSLKASIGFFHSHNPPQAASCPAFVPGVSVDAVVQEVELVGALWGQLNGPFLRG